MAETNLEFTLNEENRYETSFTSEGPVTIQLEREDSKIINVYANLNGMNRTLIGVYGNYSSSQNLILVVDVPAGVEVTIESFVEVKQAKMLSNE